MPFATVTWEISTSDPARFTRIAAAIKRALDEFPPHALLLANTALLDTATWNIESIRRALDQVRAEFPQEFFYTSSDHLDADLQGIYPPWSEIDQAQRITGLPDNPRDRPPP